MPNNHATFLTNLTTANRFFRNIIVCLTLMMLMFMSNVMGAQQESLEASENQGGSVNLRNVDIALLVETVAELTQRNFIVDPRVKGKVTVISNEELTADEIYELFLSVLDVHGYITLPVGNSIKIVPNVNARFAGDGNQGANLESLVSQVITVRNVKAVELVSILRPMLPAEAHLAALSTGNTLLLSTSAYHAQRMARLVRLLDRPLIVQNKVVALNYAKAIDVVNIFSRLQQSEAGSMLRLATIVADERTNSLIITQVQAIAPAIEDIISSLDRPTSSSSSQQQVKVLYLEYADAEKLAPIVERVAGSSVADTNLVSATSSVATNNDPNVPTSTSPSLERAEPPKVIVQAEPELNALVVAAPKDVLQVLEALVTELDVRRAQVLVEAVIAEVSTSLAEEMGVQWALRGANTLGVTNFSQNNLVSLYSNPVSLGSGLTLGVGALNNGTGIASIIRALSTDTGTNIVATPSIVTLDNREANIVVGQNVPFVTGQYTSTGSSTSGSTTTASPFQTIKRENVGVKLKILPKINKGDAITLSISQEVSSVAPQSTSASDLVTNKRTIDTNVIANDKDLIVLGGLIDDQMVNNKEKVPFLGDLPLIGGAFKYEKSTLKKRNLMVFIRPTIVRDAAMLESLSHEKYRYLRAQQVLMNQTRSTKFAEQDKPLIQALSEIHVENTNPDPQSVQEPDTAEVLTDTANW